MSFRQLILLLPFAALALCPKAASARQVDIFVRNNSMAGPPTRSVGIDLNASTEELKGVISEELGYSPANQYLFYVRALLSPGRTLLDYDIVRESIIDLSVIDTFDALSFSGFLPGPRGGFARFLMRSGVSGAGDGWSLFNYENAVDLSLTGSRAYTLNLFTVPPESPDRLLELGEMSDFDGQRAYDWTFITANGGISGFSPDQFVIETGRFANAFTGAFSVVQQGSTLALSYTPLYTAVPEPSTLVLVMTGLALGGWQRARRRKRA